MQVELMQANGLALDTLALLATYALHSSLLFGVAWLAGRALDSPRLRELLWKGALVGGLLTTGAQAVLGGGPLTLDFSALQASSWNAARIAGGSVDDAQKSIIGIHGGTAAGLVDGATTPLAVRGSTEVQHAAPLDAGQASELELATFWPLALFILWAIAAGLGLNHIRRERKALLGALRTPVKRGALREQLRILEPSLGREIELWSTPGVSSPMAIGRSAICVPPYALHDLDAQSQTALLAHEVEHLRRRDGAWLFLARALQALFPFQPLQRLAIAHMGHEAELLCDEAALRSTGNGVALARCLVLVAERLTGPALPSFSVAMATQSSPLMHRIQRVLGTPPPAASRSGVLLLTALGSAALLALACSGPRVSTKANPSAVDAQKTNANSSDERPDADEAIESLTAMGYVEVKPESHAPNKELFETLSALGYVAVEPDLPTPAIAVALTAKGDVLVNGVAVTDFGKRGAHEIIDALKPLVQELPRTRLKPDSVLAVQDPLRATASARTHFSRMLLIMMACGHYEIMMPNLQFDLEFEDGSRETFAYSLPSDHDVEEVEPVEEYEGADVPDPGTRTPTLQMRSGQCLAQLPGQDARDLDLNDADAFTSSEFLAYVNRAHDDRKQRFVTLDLGTGTTVAEVAQLLHVLKRAGLMERVLFVGTVE